tara:strand:- start:38940 stop:39443 length:504 start_codon:yes stop_codon:yes gene_type:complete
MTLLFDFFNSDDIADDAMYYFEMHGFLTSLAIQPGSLTTSQIIDEIFNHKTVDDAILNAVSALQKEIEQALLNAEFPDVIQADEDEDSLTLWATGFMQGIFMHQEQWFEKEPDLVAELTLPILNCSELLDEELDDVNLNDEVLEQMADTIPDCVIDLYLLFNTPENV